MSDHDALLAAILADPAEDTPRLVYADWLQENGQEARAEFIRVQIAVENNPSWVAPEACELRRRERAIWNAGDNVRQWWPVGDPPMSVRIDSSPAGEFEADRFALIRRGFIESVTCTAADWLAHGDRIRAANPVTKVTITTFSTLTEAEMDAFVARIPKGWLYGPLVGILAAIWRGVTFVGPTNLEPELQASVRVEPATA